MYKLSQGIVLNNRSNQRLISARWSKNSRNSSGKYSIETLSCLNHCRIAVNESYANPSPQLSCRKWDWERKSTALQYENHATICPRSRSGRMIAFLYRVRARERISWSCIVSRYHHTVASRSSVSYPRVFAGDCDADSGQRTKDRRPLNPAGTNLDYSVESIELPWLLDRHFSVIIYNVHSSRTLIRDRHRIAVGSFTSVSFMKWALRCFV